MGKIKIVSFDEANAVLQGIIDGHVHGTVSQQPYYYGYDSCQFAGKSSQEFAGENHPPLR